MRNLSLLIFALHPGLQAVLSAEEMTFVTYYPSPTGNYLNMSTTGKTTMATGTSSTDKVGIGTTNPQYKLHIEGETKMKMTDLLPLADVNPLLSGETNPQVGRLYYYTGTAPNRPKGLYFYHDGAWHKITMKEIETPVLVGHAQLTSDADLVDVAGFVTDSKVEPLSAPVGSIVQTFPTWDTLQISLASETKDWKVRFEWFGTIKVDAKSGEGIEVVLQWRKVAESFSELEKSPKLEDSDGAENSVSNSSAFSFNSKEETLKKGNIYQFRIYMKPSNASDVGTSSYAMGPGLEVKIWRTGKESD